MDKQVMDHMDIDHEMDVPDTPDRLVYQGFNKKSSVKEENRHLKLQDFFEEGTKDQPMIIDSGSRGLSLHPPKRSTNPRHLISSPSFSSASLSSSRNANLFRKGVQDKNPTFQNGDSIHTHHLRPVRPSCISMSSSSSSQYDSLVDLTEGDPLKGVAGNSSPRGVSGNNRVEFRKRSGLVNGPSSSSSHCLTNFPTASCNVRGEKDNVGGVGSSAVFGEKMECVGNIGKKAENDGLSRDSIASARANRQKRLVRNGCISPNNIAKAKQLVGKDVNGSVVVAHNNNNNNNTCLASSALPMSIDIRELVAEDRDSHTGKGKGVISYPCSSKEPDSQNKNLHGRRSMAFNEKAMETSNYITGKSTEETSGWRNTRNRTRELNISSPDKSVRKTDAPKCSNQHNESRLERRGKGISVANGDDYPMDPNLISSDHVYVQPLREPISHPRAQMGRLNGPRSVADTLIKRQKQGYPASSSNGECSTSVPNDPEVVVLSSPAEGGNSKPTSTHLDNIQQIIELDESPQVRRNSHDEDAKARQLEADERLARELQEQLYNETPVFGEVDEHIALALQNQDSRHGSSRARNPILNSRVLMSNLHRQSQPRSSSSIPRRGSLSRASTLGRMTRLRSRFPGQPRTVLPSRGRASLFPADMDVEMRMHILGALEEFSDMAVNPGILQAHRDFNEDDYEMLLALDENNDQHAGASFHQINSLPQSTVQTDNFEDCAICLDTPTIGDTIRHLPCLHKFHKDCIDPWLRRRTSCPVCKSSIT